MSLTRRLGKQEIPPAFVSCTDIFILSNKGGEAGDGCPGAWGQAAWGPVKCAVLTGWVGALLGWSGSPAALWSKKAASLGLALGRRRTELWGERGKRRQRWRRGAVFGLSGLRLGVVVGLRSGDPLLLPAPGVVVGRVADVVVDKRMGLLPVGVHLVFAVAALEWRKRERMSDGDRITSTISVFKEGDDLRRYPSSIQNQRLH